MEQQHDDGRTNNRSRSRRCWFSQGREGGREGVKSMVVWTSHCVVIYVCQQQQQHRRVCASADRLLFYCVLLAAVFDCRQTPTCVGN